ncbi:MAG TPA: hypothetical protein IAD49_00550 [Candidatus Fimihabitans intestinipullorum]|uniref:Uncharacterized protein n=1 Tax=Candidatus Fimihabitans intestinipullorum TaxID=2840820 RepID=A0A9D1HT54_9BACT|nr:hypothetical protein [Candidatus Fimihabitans intestinipullorum]
MEFILIAVIIIFVLSYNHHIDMHKFIGDTEPYFRILMEEDYIFLLRLKYGDSIDVEKMFGMRVRNGLIATAAMLFILMSQANFLNVLFSVIVGFVVFKLPYQKLKGYYKANLHRINQMLPYYLKSLEILVQHYTVPVALNRSVETAPEIFRSGLREMIAKIEAGDSSVDPYMDFAKEYPVRDSMRMMRLLYRLGLGSQENKQEQLMMFARSVSQLQNKAREQKYKERLEKMENKTMMMLMTTGGGILLLMLFSMTMMMNL